MTATPPGILAVGGSITPTSLLEAYSFGIFPWYNENDPIMWWFTHPRLVIKPTQVHVSKSMRPYFNAQKFQVRFDDDFEAIIKACRTHRLKRNEKTWLNKKIMKAMIELHHMGYAHSVSVYKDDELVGGLYGLGIGKIFCGESMFQVESNASKFGFISLCQLLDSKGYQYVDCQQETPLFRQLGGKLYSKVEYWEIIKENQINGIKPQFWNLDTTPSQESPNFVSE